MLLPLLVLLAGISGCDKPHTLLDTDFCNSSLLYFSKCGPCGSEMRGEGLRLRDTGQHGFHVRKCSSGLLTQKTMAKPCVLTLLHFCGMTVNARSEGLREFGDDENFGKERGRRECHEMYPHARFS